jgi:hypothetical protein
VSTSSPFARASLASAVLLAGCLTLPEGRYACVTDRQCPEGWHCRGDALCYSTPDGEQRDGGPRDAAALDAARLDGAAHDAAPLDGARPDAEPPSDAALADSGEPNADGFVPECTSDPACDDGNACTDDVCSLGRCVRTPHSRACDDGVFCNGADQCDGAGACSVHAGDPCPGPCVDGACTDCGLFGQPCCDDGACDGDRLCMISANTCGCGAGDCGPDFVCDFGGLCEPCGNPGQSCCEGDVCFGASPCVGRICDFVVE